MNRMRETAKFLSGIAVHEMLGHWWLGTFGSFMLPWKLPWFTFTPEWNYVCMAIWPIVAVGLVYYAWIRKPTVSHTPSPRPLAT